MKASIVIVTKNRKNDLRRAITSAILQNGSPEILVLDDGSTDGTSEMVREEFPGVLVDRTPNSLGCIAQRNRAAAMTSADIIFSIDDDAEFSSPRVVEQTIGEFSDPRIAAIAIPYIEPRKSNIVYQRAPDAGTIWVGDSFRGTAYAIRRQIFNEAGGYREQLVHQGEEADLSIRLLRSGWTIRVGYADEIIHYETPMRDWYRMNFYSRRNDIMFAWHNVPMPFFPFHLLGNNCQWHLQFC